MKVFRFVEVTALSHQQAPLQLILFTFQVVKLPRRGLNPGPAKPEADMLPSEPAQRAFKKVKY